MLAIVAILAALWLFGGSVRASLPAATPPSSTDKGGGLVSTPRGGEPFRAPAFPQRPTPRPGSTAAAHPQDYDTVWQRFRAVCDDACDADDERAVEVTMGMAGVVLLYAGGEGLATIGRITILARQGFEASCKRPWPSTGGGGTGDEARDNRGEAVGYVVDLAVNPTLQFLGNLL